LGSGLKGHRGEFLNICPSILIDHQALKIALPGPLSLVLQASILSHPIFSLNRRGKSKIKLWLLYNGE